MKKIHIRFEKDSSLKGIDVRVRASEEDGQVKDLMERVTGKKEDLLCVTAAGGEVVRVRKESIVSVSVSGKKTMLVTEDGMHTVRQSLQNMEAALDDPRFIRISRYELVNLDKVQKFDFTLSGTLRLELTGGMETWASRRCIPAIRRRLSGKEE